MSEKQLVETVDEQDKKIKQLEERLLNVESAAHVLMGEIASQRVSPAAVERLRASLEPTHAGSLKLALEIQSLRNLAFLSHSISEIYLQQQFGMKQMFSELRNQLKALESTTNPPAQIVTVENQEQKNAN